MLNELQYTALQIFLHKDLTIGQSYDTAKAFLEHGNTAKNPSYVELRERYNAMSEDERKSFDDMKASLSKFL